MESDIFDSERSPDVLLHVLFKCRVVQASDEEACPVESGTVGPACAGLEEEGERDAFQNGCFFDGRELAAGFVPLMVLWLEVIVADSR
jgi:hypothetical protein